jgi:hypothetical protein
VTLWHGWWGGGHRIRMAARIFHGRGPGELVRSRHVRTRAESETITWKNRCCRVSVDLHSEICSAERSKSHTRKSAHWRRSCGRRRPGGGGPGIC